MHTRTDTLVVGGGVIGCAVAYHLARAGLDVTLVEAQQINHGASGQNAGSLHFQLEMRFLENGEEAARQASALIALNRLAIVEWRGLEQELAEDLEVTLAGGLMVAESDAEIHALERKREREAAWGLETRIIDGIHARGIAPYLSENVRAASFLADEGHANPRLVAPAFARAALKAGASILTGTSLVRLRRDEAGGHVAEVRSASGAGVLRCRRIVLAAGAFSGRVGQMAGLQIPVYLAALTMSVTEKRTPLVPHLIQHVGRRLSMKQSRSGNILIGGGWPSRLGHEANGEFDPGTRPLVIEQSVRENLRAAVRTVPVIAALNLIRTWTGIATLTADQLPLLGEVPGASGIFVAAGGPGFTLGPTFARHLATQIVSGGAADPLFSLFSPERFAHLNRFLG
jgi:glycine/D-amino acid oxidase-like deaminating enzyme